MRIAGAGPGATRWQVRANVGTSVGMIPIAAEWSISLERPSPLAVEGQSC